MFRLQEYVNELTVTQDDVEVVQAKEVVTLVELICDDAWLARQAHYGMAGAMERQLDYLGSTLLPNSESKLQRMVSGGIIGESYVTDHWSGTTNEDDPHVNDEISFDQQVDDQKSFIEQLKRRMRTAAIIFVVHLRAHDELSNTLDQLTYSGIKSKASANRKAAAEAAVA